MIGKWLAHSTGMYGYGWIFEILILVAFFLIVYWIVRSSQERDSALDILHRRYAKGEISKKTYLHLKRDISSGEK